MGKRTGCLERSKARSEPLSILAGSRLAIPSGHPIAGGELLATCPGFGDHLSSCHGEAGKAMTVKEMALPWQHGGAFHGLPMITKLAGGSWPVWDRRTCCANPVPEPSRRRGLLPLAPWRKVLVPRSPQRHCEPDSENPPRLCDVRECP